MVSYGKQLQPGANVQKRFDTHNLIFKKCHNGTEISTNQLQLFLTEIKLIRYHTHIDSKFFKGI